MSRKPIITLSVLSVCLIGALLFRQDRTRPRVLPSAPPPKDSSIQPTGASLQPEQMPADSAVVSANTLPKPGSSAEAVLSESVALSFPAPARMASGPVPSLNGPRTVQVPNGQVAALLQIIDTPPDPFNRGWYVQVDTALIELLQHDGVFDIPAYLHSLVTDPSRDSVVRVYALQYAAEWLDKSATGISDLNSAPAQVSQILDLLWASTTEFGTTSLAGTALLNLARLAPRLPAIDTARIDQTALNLAQNANASIADRSTALSVCGESNMEEAAAVLLSVARDPEAGFSLRLAAVGALGRRGGLETVASLNEIARECDDPAIINAMSLATTKILKSHSSEEIR